VSRIELNFYRSYCAKKNFRASQCCFAEKSTCTFIFTAMQVGAVNDTLYKEFDKLLYGFTQSQLLKNVIYLS
jgi:hypothetical protein